MTKGKKIKIVAEGEDEQTVMKELTEFIEGLKE